MKSKFLIALTLACGACLPFFAYAGNVIPPTSAPFDGGLSLLIAAGVGYASKKAYEKRRKAKATTEIEQ